LVVVDISTYLTIADISLNSAIRFTTRNFDFLQKTQGQHAMLDKSAICKNVADFRFYISGGSGGGGAVWGNCSLLNVCGAPLNGAP